jgi:hypothetical protein
LVLSRCPCVAVGAAAVVGRIVFARVFARQGSSFWLCSWLESGICAACAPHRLPVLPSVSSPAPLSLQKQCAQRLDISYNRIRGTIPTEIGTMSTLHTIDAMFNQLHGTLPDEMMQMNPNLRLNFTENRCVTRKLFFPSSCRFGGCRMVGSFLKLSFWRGRVLVCSQPNESSRIMFPLQHCFLSTVQ